MHAIAYIVLWSSLTLAGCSSQSEPASAQAPAAGIGAAGAQAPRIAATGEVPQAAGALESHELAGLLPDGATLVDSLAGDLTGRHLREGVLVVEAPGNITSSAVGTGLARTVILLVRDGSGRLLTAAKNDRLVPCADCGGMAGDPYGYTRVESGELTISISGGSRERWFADYVFRYRSQHENWELERVERGVTDTHTDLRKHQTLTTADFGEVVFADFDPRTLPPAPSTD